MIYHLEMSWHQKKTKSHFTCERPKNREDGSDLDDFLTEFIAAMKTIILKSFLGQSGSKKQRRKIVRAGCLRRGSVACASREKYQ